jgi:hypothetical protein
MTFTQSELAEQAWINHAKEKLAWIKQKLETGHAVYLTSYGGHSTRLTYRHIESIAVHGNALVVRHGRRWLDHSYSKLTCDTN